MTGSLLPRLDVPNTQCLQLIVCTKTGCLTEADDTNHAVRVVNSRSLSFRQINTARTGAYTITKSYVTDPERASILIQVSIEGTTAEDRVYLYFDPSLNNSGMHDSGWSTDDALLAADANIANCAHLNGGLSERTNAIWEPAMDWSSSETSAASFRVTPEQIMEMLSRWHGYADRETLQSRSVSV